jgi:hypothetical protein
MRIKTQSHACKGSSPGPNHWAYHQVEFLNSAIQADTLLPLAYRKIPRTHASLLSLPTIASAPTRSARSVRTNNGATDSTTTNTRRLNRASSSPSRGSDSPIPPNKPSKNRSERETRERSTHLRGTSRRAVEQSPRPPPRRPRQQPPQRTRTRPPQRHCRSRRPWRRSTGARRPPAPS